MVPRVLALAWLAPTRPVQPATALRAKTMAARLVRWVRRERFSMGVFMHESLGRPAMAQGIRSPLLRNLRVFRLLTTGIGEPAPGLAASSSPVGPGP
jgi:hypothetical protein